MATAGIGLTASVAGCSGRLDGGSASETTDAAGSADPDEVSADEDRAAVEETARAVTYVRNAEEVKGHLASSVALARQSDAEGTALHAGHGSDYFAALLPPLRDADPEAATRLRALLSAAGERASTANPDRYAQFVNGEVYPALDEAVETVVPAAIRESATFDARVANALAGRIAEEYTAAVTPAGEIELSGEYWDGRGFLTRIEARVESMDGTGSEQVATLRSRMESVTPPTAVRRATVEFRVATTVAAELPGARIADRETAVAYARNAAEVRGHLASSVTLREVGDRGAAALHAGHGADYALTLLPPVRRADPELATSLADPLFALGEAVEESADAYATYVSEEVLPTLDRAERTAIPDEYGGTSFEAAVILALADRIEGEYTKAVTDEEVIELYGEYWDARGFLTRIEDRFDGIASDLDVETREEVTEELEILREELETAATPTDVAGSIDALHEQLASVAEA